MRQWRYPARDRNWLACPKRHDAIQRDDREELLDRVLMQPVPRTVPERYAPRSRQHARKLHEKLWQTREGPPGPA